MPESPKPTVRLRVEAFTTIAERHGAKSIHDKARWVGCSYGAMWRALRGHPVQGSFIAALSGRLPRYRTEALFDFEVPDDRAA